MNQTVPGPQEEHDVEPALGHRCRGTRYTLTCARSAECTYPLLTNANLTTRAVNGCTWRTPEARATPRRSVRGDTACLAHVRTRGCGDIAAGAAGARRTQGAIDGAGVRAGRARSAHSAVLRAVVTVVANQTAVVHSDRERAQIVAVRIVRHSDVQARRPGRDNKQLRGIQRCAAVANVKRLSDHWPHYYLRLHRRVNQRCRRRRVLQRAVGCEHANHKTTIGCRDRSCAGAATECRQRRQNPVWRNTLRGYAGDVDGARDIDINGIFVIKRRASSWKRSNSTIRT